MKIESREAWKPASFAKLTAACCAFFVAFFWVFSLDSLCLTAGSRTSRIGKVKKKMATKGGSRRQAVPEVDTDQLRTLFEHHVKEHGVKKAFFFGSYSNIARTQAVECGGLAENYDVLKQVPFS